jgi:hypothetical protein
MRYFRITCQPGAYSYPTPEGFFQIGQIFIGMFNQLQWNPEYPEDKSRTRNIEVVRTLGGNVKTKRLGRASLQRKLNFTAIDTNTRGFLAQLKSFYEHVRGKRLVYIPDIEENEGTNGHYTFNLIPCFVVGNMDVPSQKGNLSTVAITFEEDI